LKTALAAILVVSATACLSERERPSPPLVSVTLSDNSVTSPDTLRGTVRAEDPDGIDSLWVTLDTQQRAGTDGFFQRTVLVPFRLDVPPGLSPGTILDIRLEARDIVGFRSILDTLVTVIP
jgi:hypothetical protein